MANQGTQHGNNTSIHFSIVTWKLQGLWFIGIVLSLSQILDISNIPLYPRCLLCPFQTMWWYSWELILSCINIWPKENFSREWHVIWNCVWLPRSPFLLSIHTRKDLIIVFFPSMCVNVTVKRGMRSTRQLCVEHFYLLFLRNKVADYKRVIIEWLQYTKNSPKWEISFHNIFTKMQVEL